MPGRPLTILLVEHDARVRQELENALLQGADRVRGVSDIDQAIIELDRAVHDVLIINFEALGSRSATLPADALQPDDHFVIVHSGPHDVNQAVQMMRWGARDYLPRPFDPVRLSEA